MFGLRASSLASQIVDEKVGSERFPILAPTFFAAPAFALEALHVAGSKYKFIRTHALSIFGPAYTWELQPVLGS